MSADCADVLAHPLVGLLFELADRGIVLRTEPPDHVWIVSGRERLTPEERAQLVAVPAVLYLLVLLGEPATGDRTLAFTAELARARGTRRLPVLHVRRGVAYREGVCSSCGDPLPTPRYGVCLPCALARRLACGCPIPSTLADALEQSSAAEG